LVCIIAGVYTNVWQRAEGTTEFPYMEFTNG